MGKGLLVVPSETSFRGMSVMLQSSIAAVLGRTNTSTVIPKCRVLLGPCRFGLCPWRDSCPREPGQGGEGHLQALLRACTLACWVLEGGEPGKTLLGMDVGNRSAVPRAQELRASNRLELVWSEAVLTQAAPAPRGQGVA